MAKEGSSNFVLFASGIIEYILLDDSQIPIIKMCGEDTVVFRINNSLDPDVLRESICMMQPKQKNAVCHFFSYSVQTHKGGFCRIFVSFPELCIVNIPQSNSPGCRNYIFVTVAQRAAANFAAGKFGNMPCVRKAKAWFF